MQRRLDWVLQGEVPNTCREQGVCEQVSNWLNSAICVRTTGTHLSLHEAGFLGVGLAIYTFSKFLGHAHQWEPHFWTSLVVQGLKYSPCNAVDVSLIPGWGAKTPQAVKQLGVPQLLSLFSGACEPQLESPGATVKDPAWHCGDPVCQD